MANHLDFDTDFLNNVSEKKVDNQPQNNATPPKKGGGNKGWIIAAVVFGILLVIGAMDDSSTSTNTTYTPPTPTPSAQNQNSLVFGGQTFSCSDYHYDKAMALQPDAILSAQIDSESDALDARVNSLNLELARIEGMYVDEYSQYSIDTYNNAVDSYDLKKDRLQTEIDSWNLKNTSFNKKIDTYNDYLDTNCRPQ